MRKRTVVFVLSLAIILSSAATSAFFLMYILPSMTHYMSNDPQYINLSENSERVYYHKVLDKAYLGRLYLRHPAYFYKRSAGKEILQELALRGYTPAAFQLYAFNIIKGDGYTHSHMAEAKKWAVLAAEQGDHRPLYSLLKVEDLGKYEDVKEEVGLLAKLAPEAEYPWSALYLSDYFANQNNPKKAAHWAQVATDIDASPFTEPACTTITPWRGY